MSPLRRAKSDDYLRIFPLESAERATWGFLEELFLDFEPALQTFELATSLEDIVFLSAISLPIQDKEYCKINLGAPH